MQLAYRFAPVGLRLVPAPESPSPPISLRIRDGVAHLILNRPALNVLDIASLCQLNQALRESDQPAVRVVLISSALPFGGSSAPPGASAPPICCGGSTPQSPPTRPRSGRRGMRSKASAPSSRNVPLPGVTAEQQAPIDARG